MVEKDGGRGLFCVVVKVGENNGIATLEVGVHNS